MKIANIALIVIGVIILLFVAITPLPTIFEIHGVAWRIIIGLLGCFALVLGVYKSVRKK